MTDERRFTDAEVREIFARAAEHVEEAERAEEHAPAGLTLGELVRIGREAGIPAERVTGAARELDRRPSGLRALRAADPIEVVRAVPAVPTDAAWERIVLTLREAFGVNGIVSRFGEAREWCSTSETRGGAAVLVRVEPSPDGATLSLRADPGDLAHMPAILGGTFAAAGGVVGLLLTLGDFDSTAFWAIGLLLAVAVVAAGASWAGMRRWSTLRRRRLQGAADRIELLLARDSRPGP